MITLRIYGIKTGDSQVVLSEEEAAKRIIQAVDKMAARGQSVVARFDDGTELDIARRSGILEQLQKKEGSTVTVVPPVSGG